MRVSDDQYLALLELLARAREAGAADDDIDALEGAVTFCDGGTEIDDEPTVCAAFERIAVVTGDTYGFTLFAPESRGKPHWFLTGRRFYDRSPLLQAVRPEEVDTPAKAVTFLLELRQRLFEEQRDVRGVDRPSPLGFYSLGMLIQALIAGGQITGDPIAYQRLATARDLYDRSAILRSIEPRQVNTPEKAIAHILTLRDQIAEEQRSAVPRLGANNIDSYALETLIAALAVGGKISGNLHTYQRLAAARDLHDRSPILRAITPDEIGTPERAVALLLTLRDGILTEQRTSRGIHDAALGTYALGTLLEALYAAGKISGSFLSYQIHATARDLFDHSPTLRTIKPKKVNTPERAIALLLTLRERIVAEQRAARGVDEAHLPSYSLGTLVEALFAGGTITENRYTYLRRAGARDFYDRSPTLQAIDPRDVNSPAKAVALLVRLREGIVAEQRAVRGVDPQDLDSYALTTLVDALLTGGKITGNRQLYERFAGDRDRFDRSPTLRSIPADVLEDDRALMRFLLDRRDQIAREALTASGRAPEFPWRAGLQDHYALITLVAALRAGGLITERRYSDLARRVATPLEYFWQRRLAIEREVRRAMALTGRARRGIDRSLFTWINDPARRVSATYRRSILRWGAWFIEDPTIFTRSLFGAAEIAVAAMLPPAPLIPDGFVRQLEDAVGREGEDPWGARAQAVEALGQTIEHYAGLQAHPADPPFRRWLDGIRRVADWNHEPTALPPQGGGSESFGGTIVVDRHSPDPAPDLETAADDPVAPPFSDTVVDAAAVPAPAAVLASPWTIVVP